MGKGRSFKTDKEFTREQELSYKNKQLQREVAKLKREIEKLRASWTDRPYEEPETEEPAAPKKKDRICYECSKGRLNMIVYGKPDGEWYYRSCDFCSYRTRSKKLTEEVES